MGLSLLLIGNTARVARGQGGDYVLKRSAGHHPENARPGKARIWQVDSLWHQNQLLRTARGAAGPAFRLRDQIMGRQAKVNFVSSLIVRYQHVTCLGDRNGFIQFITVVVVGGTPPYRYSIDGGRTFQAGTFFSDLPSGTYPLAIQDARNLVYSTVSITIGEAPSTLSVGAGQTPASCAAATDGALQAQGQGGMPPYRYSIQPAGGEESPFQEEGTFSGLAPGAYTLRVRDAYGCIVSTEQRVEEAPLPPAGTISGPLSVCPGAQGVTYALVNPASPSGYRWFIRGGAVVAGQGSARITVDWGDQAAGALVQAVGTTALGCPTDTARLPVQLNPVLQPTVAGPSPVCFAESKGVRYETSSTPGSVYAWQVIGGTIVSADPSAHFVRVDWQAGVSRGKILVTETSITGLARCSGSSDTLFVDLLPSPDPLLAVEGPGAICASDPNSVYSLKGRPGSTYAWALDGTPLPGTGSSVTVSVAQAGTYTLTVTETTDAGCVGQPIQQQITVLPLPTASTVSGPAAVCPENLNGLVFRLEGLPGSSYAWTVRGGTLRSGQGTGQVTVDFDAAADLAVSVQETSAAGCPGPLLSLPVRYDAASLQLFVASTDEQDEQQIVLQLAMPRNTANTSPLRVFRREAGQDWAILREITNTATTFSDGAVDPQSQPYSYRIESTNACGTPLVTNAHRTIWLQASGNERQGTVSLRWTRYRGWDQGVQEYQILRKMDGETAYSLFRTVPAADSALTATVAREGFRQTFRVRAVPAGGGSPALVSWSNSAGVSFEHPLAFYNIFSPNGDGVNDTFTIDNIRLYPGNELAVFNRWGKEIYRRQDYDNSWDGGNLAEGVYYYQLTLPDRTARKGWVEIVR